MRLQPDDLAALDAYRVDDEPMTRPQAIRAALSGWLQARGFIASAKPSSSTLSTLLAAWDAATDEDRQQLRPAIEAFDAMDAAIKQDQIKRRRKL